MNKYIEQWYVASEESTNIHTFDKMYVMSSVTPRCTHAHKHCLELLELSGIDLS